MQVNFNPSVNQVRPNFKAHFDKDSESKNIIRRLSQGLSGQTSILAAHLALQDIEANDTVSLTSSLNDAKNDIYIFNSTNNRAINLGSFDSINADNILLTIFDKKLLDESPKQSIKYYLSKAMAMIAENAMPELNQIKEIEQQIKVTLANPTSLKNKFLELNETLFYKRMDFIEKEIFSLAKKVK